MTSRSRAKFIVIYGVNNTGKTTQAKKLVEKIKQKSKKAEYLKYPIYDLEPSGPILNNYLREGNNYQLNPREAQIIYTLNRLQFENELKKKLNNNINIIAEDYIGTGLAWGIGTGIKKDFLERLNSCLLKEDLAILLDGSRFTQAEESKHQHENNQQLIEEVKKIHQQLAHQYHWHIVNANQDIEAVHNDIWRLVEKII